MSAYPSPEHQFITSTLGSDAGTPTSSQKRTKSTANGKRGRKPKNTTVSTPQEVSTPTTLQWTQPSMPAPSTSQSTMPSASQSVGATAEGPSTQTPYRQSPTTGPSTTAPSGLGGSGSEGNVTSGLVLPTGASGTGQRIGTAGPGAAEEEAEGEDELLPAMADDDYSAQLSWQSQSKDNLKCAIPLPSCVIMAIDDGKLSFRVLMDSFTPEQYERFEAYRRHALPKQAVRKVHMSDYIRPQRDHTQYLVALWRKRRSFNRPLANKSPCLSRR